MHRNSGESYAVPDIGPSPAQIAATRTLLGVHADSPDQCELAVLGGSLAAGLGHATSAVTVIGVGDGLPRGGAAFELNGTVVHLRTIEPQRARDLVDGVADFRMTDQRHPQARAPWESLAVLVDFADGLVLRSVSPWPERLTRLRSGSLLSLLVARHAIAATAAGSTAFGALMTGDLYTADNASEEALVAACESALCARGDLYFGRTFLFRRLSRTALSGMCQRHLKVLLSDPGIDTADPPASRALIEQRLFAATALLAKSALGEVDTSPEHDGSARRYAVSAGTGPRRNPYFGPVRFADGFSLIGPNGMFDVSELVLRLWRWLDGWQLGELARVLADNEPELARIDIDDIGVAIGALQQIGAVNIGAPTPGITASEQSGPGTTLDLGELTVSPSSRAPFTRVA